MRTIAFIGLGNMGIGMATNLAKDGHEVRALDISKEAIARAVEAGCVGAANAKDAVEKADVVVTMLPAGAHVKICLLYTSPSPRDATLSRMPSSA